MVRLTFLVYVLFLIGCKTAKVNSSNEFPMIMMEKTACMGACPTYVFNIYPDGTATYRGTKNVNNIGNYTAKLSVDQLQQIQTTFRDADFFKFADVYSANMTDLPTTFIYYHNGRENLKITDYYGAPETLKTLEKAVETFISTIVWKKD